MYLNFCPSRVLTGLMVIGYQPFKYTPTQLGVAGSLLPKTIRDALPNRDVNRRTKKNYRFALNSNNVDCSLIAKGMLTNMATVHLYLLGVAWNSIVTNKSISHITCTTNMVNKICLVHEHVCVKSSCGHINHRI